MPASRSSDLPVLADLRREAGIRVTIADGRAWVCWDDEPASGSEATRRILVTRLLPRPGVEIFARRDGRWHRPGEHLPAFGVPIGDGSSGGALDRVILPEPMSVARPGRAAPRTGPAPPGARRRTAGPGRRPRCDAGSTGSPRGPSGRRRPGSSRSPAAWSVPAGGGPGEAEVLLLGPAARLPVAEDGLRFWGVDVLIPLGYRAEPDLAERALRAPSAPGRTTWSSSMPTDPSWSPAGPSGRSAARASGWPWPGRGRDARPRRPRS